MHILHKWECILGVRWQKAYHLPIVRMCFGKYVLAIEKLLEKYLLVKHYPWLSRISQAARALDGSFFAGFIFLLLPYPSDHRGSLP